MNKTESIADYIETFPQTIQTQLRQVYNVIKGALPKAEEAISYGMPTFKVKGKNVVHFAAFTNHIGFYPTPDGIAKFQAELSQYKSAKGSVQFPLHQPMPLDLIKEITLYRLQQTIEKGKKNKD